MADNAKNRARFVINMNTGAHGPRTDETDKYPLTFKFIDDETCKALATKKITGMQVVEAIKKKMLSRPDFSWEEYDRRRQAEKTRMNVSQHDMVPVGDDTEKEEEQSTPEDVVTLSSLGIGTAPAAAGSGASGKPAQPKRTSKIDDALGL